MTPKTQNAFLAKRRAERRAAANAAWDLVRAELDRSGIDYQLFGSFLRDDFAAHSDIDLMILGEPSGAQMGFVWRLTDAATKQFGVPFDLLFASYLTDQNVADLLED